MKLIEHKVTQFLDEVDSKSPAPGGGSVAALSSALGVSLTRMVGHLSIEKKKFAALPHDIQTQFKQIIESFILLKEELLELVDHDTEAFNLIMKAFQLPKTTESEILIRKEHIEKATLKAIEVPQKVANLSLRALEDLYFILEYGNQQTISDIGVAALSLASGIEGACLNILINLPVLSNIDDIMIYKKEVETILHKSHVAKEEVLAFIYKKLT